MSNLSLTRRSQPDEPAGGIITAFIASVLAAETGLLIVFSIQRGGLFTLSLCGLLLLALAVGFIIARQPLFHRVKTLRKIYWGFFTCALGILLIIPALQGRLAGEVLAVAVVISGFGAGIICTALAQDLTDGRNHPLRRRLALIVYVAMLAAALCSGYGVDNTHDYSLAFAIVADLALLGAVYSKIIYHDRAQ